MNSYSIKNYNTINFKDNIKTELYIIDRIYYAEYISEKIILVLLKFKQDDRVYLLKYDIDKKKRLFLKSKNFGKIIKPFEFKLNIQNNYIIFYPLIDKNLSKFAQIIVWNFEEDTIFHFNSDFMHKIDILLTYNNYILISRIENNSANIIYIYNIHDTLNDKNKKQSNFLFANLVTLSSENKKIINLDKEPFKLKDNITLSEKIKKFFLINFNIVNNNFLKFPDIIVLYDSSYYIYKYKIDRNGYNLSFFIKNNTLLENKTILSAIILDTKNNNILSGNNGIFYLVRDNTKSDEMEALAICMENNSIYTNFKVVNNTANNVYSRGIELIEFKNNIFYLFIDNSIYIKNKITHFNKLMSIKNSNLVAINQVNLNLLTITNEILHEYKHITIYPLITSQIFISHNNKDKTKYINSILSNFSIFKNYIINNNLLKIGLLESDFIVFNHKNMFNNIKNFLQNIREYIKSLPEKKYKSKINKDKLLLAVIDYHKKIDGTNSKKNRIKRSYQNILMDAKFNNKKYNLPDEEKNGLINYQLELIYKKFIFYYIDYINNIFKKKAEINSRFIQKEVAIIKRKNEIEDILTFIEINGIKKTNILYPRIDKNGQPILNNHGNQLYEEQINSGGVTQSFFTKLEELLNIKFHLNNKIRIIKNEDERVINGYIESSLEREKMKSLNERKSREEIKKRYNSNYNIIKNKIKNISNERNFHIAKHLQIGLDDYTIFDILVLSKINNNPIYYRDNKLKNIVLKEVIKIYKESEIRNILCNLLLLNDADKIDEKYLNDIKNINNKQNNQNNQNNNKFTVNSIKSLELIDKINTYIFQKFYVNMLDVYVSHFIKFNINIDSLINKITFNTYGNNNDEIFINFKKNFIKCLKLLNQDDLILFNMSITGSNREKNEYKIGLKILTESDIDNKARELNMTRENYLNSSFAVEPEFHTCFNTMYINNIKGFEEKYLKFNEGSNNWNANCKKHFIDLWKTYSPNTMYSIQ